MSAMANQPGDGAGADSRVDPRGDPFLGTRFVAPVRPATFLRRERLVERLDQGLTTPLTLVDGPAGAGKTLLVADWAERLGRPVAWLTAEAADQAPGVFWAYLLQALRAAGTRLSPGIGSPAHAGSVDQTLLARLAADLGDMAAPAILVLDEFERVPALEVAEQLEFVLHHAGRGMRLILVTRSEPLLPLHRYRAAGTVTEIRGAELAFTPAEAAGLLDVHGMRLSEDAVSALVHRTQGWAAGLRLCALAAQRSADPERCLKEFEAGQSTVADYLLAEVLKRQPAETQDLLLRVSVVERFRPALADALTGRTDAEAVLARLHHENAFVEPLGHDWYRLHPLFAEILRAHLRVRHPRSETELHRRAARWLAHGGSLAETLAHGSAAGDWEFTSRALVDDLAIGRLFTALRSDCPAELFARMTPEADGPAASIVRAARALADDDLEHGILHLRRAQQLLSEDTADPVARLSCALLEALVARRTGSPGRAEWAASVARDLQDAVPAERLDRHPELLALLLTHLGSTRLWSGHSDAARAALTEAAGSAGGAATAVPRQDALGHLALLDYLDGWIARAERRAHAALREAERYGVPAHARSGIGRLVLATVAVDRDELDAAQALIDEADAARKGADDPVTAAGRALAASRLLLARGSTQAAVAAAEPHATAVVASPWAEDRTVLVTAAARLAEGDAEAAVKLLEPAMDHRPAWTVEAARARLAAGDVDEAHNILDGLPATVPGGPALTVPVTLVRAEVADRAGDPATARRLVARALADARRDRLRRPFLDAGPWIRPLLAAAPADEPVRDWLDTRPRTPVRRVREDDGELPPVVEEVSPRERDVLRRLALLMSTEEIAADLYVSVNTVKTHLKSIYRKLSVNRRGDAVRRARELRLL
ncbi:LuxR C-terminal-related transcriptional regulator [Streptomyces brasiliensis]|uniref:Transcriptional regulator n=1 Tax=Streptomyces brasiliensis TaxID=1954 RepID=A0A917K0R8_9ACTN|nr:LuxR C-terminal-related transcriptional regulator [Streptomyces brasiliensis]GGI96089.1 transcriptional regulator [Streptomyces brasiliensis]